MADKKENEPTTTDEKKEKLVIPRAEGMKQVTFWIPEEKLAAWNKFSETRHRGHKNRSKLIVTAVDTFIANGGIVPSDLDSKGAKRVEIVELEEKLNGLSAQLADLNKQMVENARTENRFPKTGVAGRVFLYLSAEVEKNAPDEAPRRVIARADTIAMTLQEAESDVLDVLTTSKDYEMDAKGFWRLVKQ